MEQPPMRGRQSPDLGILAPDVAAGGGTKSQFDPERMQQTPAQALSRSLRGCMSGTALAQGSCAVRKLA
jgi:hypothetical protein